MSTKCSTDTSEIVDLDHSVRRPYCSSDKVIVLQTIVVEHFDLQNLSLRDTQHTNSPKPYVSSS